MGFLAGAFVVPAWQVAVETAQVMAGEVQYPPDNPFYLYHLKAWSLIHQVMALLFRLGCTGWMVTWVLSGFLGALSFASLSLCTYALCRRIGLSLFAPLFVYALYFSHDQGGLVYEIRMLGYHGTYGILGRGFVLLALGLLACGHRWWGFFLLGTGPSFHATWGAWGLGAGLAAMVLTGGLRKGEMRRWGVPLALGLGVTLASFGVQWIYARQVAPVDSAESIELVRAFMAHWDFHRQSTGLDHPGNAAAFSALALSLAGLFGTKDRVRPPASLLLVAVGLSVAFLPAAWFSRPLQDVLPMPVLMAMPARFANLSIYALPALLLGFMGRGPLRPAKTALLACLVAYLFFALFWMEFLRSDRFGWHLPHWIVLSGASFLGVALEFWPGRSLLLRRQAGSRRIYAALVGAGLAAGCAAPFVTPEYSRPCLAVRLHRWPMGPVLQTVAKGEGMVLCAVDMQLIQARTAQPILLNTVGLNQVIYVPESGPGTDRILRRIYGGGIQDDPAEFYGYAESRAIFEERPRREWEEIGREFGVKRVLAWAGWKLDLPKLAEDDVYALYAISE